MLGLALLMQVQIAPCVAITGTDSVRADKCIPVPVVVPPDTTPPPDTTVRNSHAFGLWSPSAPTECSKALHDSYAVVVDGVRYPTWHPPVHPTGCHFGHEHGKDPSGSALYAETGAIPFGLANEALLAEGGLIRHEDHAGHKVEWLNGATFKGTAYTRTCDVLVKLHQGSHSPDAFTNNLHEMVYHLRCSDGAKVALTTLVNIGPWGQFTETCTSEKVTVSLTPPDGLPNGFGGTRFIPTRKCVDRDISGPRSYARYATLTENWAVDPTLYLASGQRVAFLATYAFVGLPARYYDPTRLNALARTLDLCWETNDPRDGRTMDECKVARTRGVTAWDDPMSPFKGTSRTIQFNQIIVSNVGGPRVFYTDAFGRRGQVTRFPGSIRQEVSPMDNKGVQVIGPGASGQYDAPGVRGRN